VLSVEDWAEIRRLHRAEGMPIKAIVRRMKVSRNTVRAALASDVPPKYERAPAGSFVDEYEPAIRELLKAFPTMPATVIAERVGWPHSIRVLSARVAQLRPAYLPPDPAGRTAYNPGDIAQCDFWFPDTEVPVGFGQSRRAKQLPVLVMTCGYSRWLCALLIPSRAAEDLFAGWWALIHGLGAVPRTLVWDGEGAVGRWRSGRSELTGECQAFRGTLSSKVLICKPRDPETKGVIERSNGYLETSFLPGRSFSSPGDFNVQLGEWLALANGRRKRTLGCAPTERIGADRAAMLTLPPVAPTTGARKSLLLPRDHYVRVDSNDYSVHPAVIGQRIEVVTDLHRIRAFQGGRPVAEHVRVWAKHQTVTDPAHRAAADALRHNRMSVVRPPMEAPVQQRELSDYDRLLGITDLEGGAA
jgi:transposase